MQRPTGVTLIAIWHFIGALGSLLGMCAMTIPIIAVWADQGNPEDALIATIVLLFVMFVVLVIGVALAIVGWGLWRLKPWSRVAAIVFAVLGLLGFPIGTIIGALILYYLLRDPDAKAAFGVT